MGSPAVLSRWVLAAAVISLVGACSSGATVGRSEGGAKPTISATSFGPEGSQVASTSTAPAGTTTRPGSGPASPTTEPPTMVLPVTQLAPHRAVYRGGKLYLEGTVPSRRVADAFKQRAAAVIGPDNVVDNYIINADAAEPTDGRVVVDEPLLFPTGSAQLDPAYYALANLGVAVMKLNPKVKMRVLGFTDDVGDDLSNLFLSQARADAVVAYISARGVARSRFEAKGMGEDRPEASNATEQGRRLNRRIEVELLDLLA